MIYFFEKTLILNDGAYLCTSRQTLKPLSKKEGREMSGTDFITYRCCIATTKSKMAYHSYNTEDFSSTFEEQGIDAFFSNSHPLFENKPKKCFQMHRRLFGRNNHWNVVEKHNYNEFLKENMDSFLESRQFKNSQNIYFSMAVYIKSKNYAQCRAHHFKMLTRFGSVQAIITQHQRWFSEEPQTAEKLGQFRGLRVVIDDEVKNIAEPLNDKKFLKFLDQDCWGYGSQSYETDQSSLYLF